MSTRSDLGPTGADVRVDAVPVSQARPTAMASDPKPAAGTSIAKCRVCETEYLGRPFWHHKAFALYECPKCRFITTWPIPTIEELALFYSEEYFREQHRVLEDWDTGRRGIFRQISRLLRACGINEQHKILDVGSGYSFLLRHLAASGFQCEGVEISECCVSYHRAHFQIPVHDGTLEELEGHSRYDAVLFADVFEHLPDFRRSLEAAKRLLTPEGLVLIRVPNMLFHMAKFRVVGVLRIPWPYEMFTVPDHLNHFTLATLVRVLKTAGFRIVLRLNGFPDLTGDRFRNFSLLLWFGAANAISYLTANSLLVGNSLVVVAQRDTHSPVSIPRIRGRKSESQANPK